MIIIKKELTKLNLILIFLAVMLTLSCVQSKNRENNRLEINYGVIQTDDVNNMKNFIDRPYGPYWLSKDEMEKVFWNTKKEE